MHINRGGIQRFMTENSFDGQSIGLDGFVCFGRSHCIGFPHSNQYLVKMSKAYFESGAKRSCLFLDLQI